MSCTFYFIYISRTNIIHANRTQTFVADTFERIYSNIIQSAVTVLKINLNLIRIDHGNFQRVVRSFAAALLFRSPVLLG